MTKTIHRRALIVLSYFTLFFPFFSKGVETHFVEPVRFGLFCVVVSLCVSTTLKKKKSCGVSNFLEKMFLLFSVRGRKEVRGKLEFMGFF